VQHISKQYEFSDDLIETLYKIVSSEKSSGKKKKKEKQFLSVCLSVCLSVFFFVFFFPATNFSIFLFFFNFCFAEFKPDEIIPLLQKLRQDIETIVLKFAAVAEDKNQLLELVVQAVGFWANLFEITDKIRTRLVAEEIQQEVQDLVARKKRLGKVRTNLHEASLRQILHSFFFSFFFFFSSFFL